MSSFPWLTVIGAIPLAGALVIAIIPTASSGDQAALGPGDAPSGPGDASSGRGDAAVGPSGAAVGSRDLLTKQIALVTSLVTLGMTIAMAVKFSPSGPAFQFVQVYQWIPQFGVHYAVGVDGIALVLIGMTAVLTPVVILASWHDADPGRHGDSAPAGSAGSGPTTPPKRSVKTYFALLLVLETMVIGVFAATDVFLFYVFFEAMLIPMYFMIGSYGVGQRQYAAVKFLLYSLLGGLLMLVAVIALYVYSAQDGHPGTFLFSQLTHVALSTEAERWLFLGFFVAFAIKAPLWPFHTWLPDAATSAQPGAAVLLVGVLDKVGTFGMIRYCLQLFPSASRYFTPLILTLAVIGVLYAAVVAIGQADIKRLIAYTSVSHFGLITLGIFVLTSQGQAGATLYMVNHGFATGALFLIAGFMITRRRSQRIADYGGVQSVAPVLAGLFLVSGLAMLSLPGLSTFVSEFLVLVGTFTRYRVAAVAATAGMILAAIYILWLYQRTMTGPVRPEVEKFPDLKARELLAVGPLIALIIVFGFVPQPLLDIINPAVKHTLVQVHATDPVPQHPAPAELSRHPATPPGGSGPPLVAALPGRVSGSAAVPVAVLPGRASGLPAVPVAVLPGRASGLPAAPVTVSHRQKGTAP